MSKHFDIGSIVIIVITFVLFVTALFVKGMTQDLLLEAGVFLVSLKLILMAFKLRVAVNGIRAELKEIKTILANSGHRGR